MICVFLYTLLPTIFETKENSFEAIILFTNFIFFATIYIYIYIWNRNFFWKNEWQLNRNEKLVIISYFKIDDIFLKIHSLLRLIFSSSSSSSSKNLKTERRNLERILFRKIGPPRKILQLNLIWSPYTVRARFLFLYTHEIYRITETSRKWAETFSLEYTSDVYRSRFSLRISRPSPPQ